MKSNFFLTISIVCAFVLASSCDKSSSSSTKPALKLQKSNVKIGEPVVATAQNLQTTGAVQWKANGIKANWQASSGDSAVFLFTSPGNYIVSAAYNSNGSSGNVDSLTIQLTVSDSIYTDTSTHVCEGVDMLPFKNGETINLIPYIYSDSAGLVFMASTTNAYDYSPLIVSQIVSQGTSGVFESDFQNVESFPCIGYNVPSPAIGYIFFAPSSEGTFTLRFKLNGTVYEGTVTLTSSGASFQWTYTSGIVITQTSIPKL